MKLKIHLKNIFILFSSTFLIFSCSTTVPSKHFAELSASDVPHIAMVRVTRNNNTIVLYNTEMCAQIGDACGFFRSQAHAHTVLLDPVLLPENYPESAILAADCWAAKHAPNNEVVAAVEFLSDTSQHGDLPIVGNPQKRADNIKSCAQESGNW